MLADMARRIAAPAPILHCDDPDRWDKCWRSIARTRRQLLGEEQASRTRTARANA
jgi:hypothetical protein